MPRKISEEHTRKEIKVPPLFGGIDPKLEQMVGICAIEKVFDHAT